MRPSQPTPRLPAANRWLEWCATLVFVGGAFIVSCFFAWIVGDIFWHGIRGVNWEFLTSEPSQAGTAGGILPMICSTLLVLAVALSAAVPLSIATAVFLSEFSRGIGMFSFLVERSLIVLAAVPSIVFGLFGNVLFCNWMGLGYSILSGGLTLACMVLPIMIRALQAGLDAVPQDYRLAAEALGMSKTRTVVSILLPAAAPGLIVGLVLGIGRVLAETAALLYTSGNVDRYPEWLFDSGRTLSIHIFDLSMNVAGGEGNAYATAVVLLILILLFNSLALTVTDRLLKRRVGVF